MVIVEKPVTAIEDVRAALNVVADGLLGRTTVSAGTWDAAVATLAASHSHLGGHTRELLYRFFQASDPTQDLMGRLSNPPDPLKTLAGQGIEGSSKDHEEPLRRAIRSPMASGSDVSKTPGRLSNPPREPVQRRLNEVEIDELVSEYQAGRTLADLASELGLHRRTVAAHLEGRGVPRRVNRRKMTHDDLREAARRYRGGDSLAKVAVAFDVDAATVRRELHRAGVAIRPRRGWT